MTKTNLNPLKDKYVREGYILLDFGCNISWNLEKTGKAGRPPEYPDGFIKFASLIRFTYHMPYRQLEGFMMRLQAFLGIPKIADFSTLFRRIIKGAKTVKTLANKDYNTIIVDSSGMSKVSRCSYLGQKWGVRRPFVKIHFGVNEDGEVVFFDVGEEKGGGDSKVAIKRLRSLRQKPKKLFGDGGYDSKEIFKFCDENGIDPAILIRKNAREKRLSNPLRAKEIDLQKKMEKWKELKNYNLRTTVERTFSAFKRRFGSSVRATKYETESVYRMIECFMWQQNV